MRARVVSTGFRRPACPIPAAAGSASAAASHRVHGPSALGGDLHRFWSLTFTLARTEFKLRFFGSVLGYVWTLMRPLLLFGVLLFVFTEIFNVNKDNPVDTTPSTCSTSIILFTFFQETTSGSVPSLVGRENLLRKMRFPRLVIPLSVALLQPLQPRHEPDRRVHLHPRQRRHADARAGSSCRCSW